MRLAGQRHGQREQSLVCSDVQSSFIYGRGISRSYTVPGPEQVAVGGIRRDVGNTVVQSEPYVVLPVESNREHRVVLQSGVDICVSDGSRVSVLQDEAAADRSERHISCAYRRTEYLSFAKDGRNVHGVGACRHSVVCEDTVICRGQKHLLAVLHDGPDGASAHEFCSRECDGTPADDFMDTLLACEDEPSADNGRALYAHVLSEIGGAAVLTVYEEIVLALKDDGAVHVVNGPYFTEV